VKSVCVSCYIVNLPLTKLSSINIKHVRCVASPTDDSYSLLEKEEEDFA